MNSREATEPDTQKPTTRFVRRTIILSAIVATGLITTWLAYPHVVALRLQRQLESGSLVTEPKPVISALIAEDTQPARDVLATFGTRSAFRAYDPFHNVLFMADVSGTEFHAATPWGWSGWFPTESTGYVDVTIVENRPECVVFALKDQSGESVTLHILTYRHTAVRQLSTDELADCESRSIPTANLGLAERLGQRMSILSPGS